MFNDEIKMKFPHRQHFRDVDLRLDNLQFCSSKIFGFADNQIKLQKKLKAEIKRVNSQIERLQG